MLSAFRAFRSLVGTEWKVIAFVAAGLLVGELGMRCVQNRLSVDVGHLRSFQSRALELTSSTQHPQVLFLGNSMTRYGISPEAFSEEFVTRTGVQPALVKVNPDNTALADWYYAYRNYFYEPHRAPEFLVIGFEGEHLRDRPTRHPGRLAQYYCDFGDWQQLCEFDLKSFEDRAAYLLSSFSAMYSNRDRLQRRVLDLIIPGYREGSEDLNVRQTTLAARQASVPTYQRLEGLLEMARQQQVHVLLAAMPIAAEYELDPQLLEVIRRENVPLIDCRHIPGIVPPMFPDGIHMTQDASVLYSRYLADAVSEMTLPVGKPTPQLARH